MRMGRRFMPPTQLLLHMKLYRMVVNSVPTYTREAGRGLWGQHAGSNSLMWRLLGLKASLPHIWCWLSVGLWELGPALWSCTISPPIIYPPIHPHPPTIHPSIHLCNTLNAMHHTCSQYRELRPGLCSQRAQSAMVWLPQPIPLTQVGGQALEAGCEQACAQASVGTGVCLTRCGPCWAEGCTALLWQRAGPELCQWTPSPSTHAHLPGGLLSHEPRTPDQLGPQKGQLS